MNEDGIRYNITEIIRTKQEAHLFLTDLNNLVSSLYNVKTAVEEKLYAHLPHNKKIKILELCQQNNINTNDVQNFLQFIHALIKYIETLPVVTVHLARELPDKEIEIVSEWLVKTAKREILLDIQINAELLGGAVIEMNGVYKDFTVKKMLEDTLKPENLINLING